MQYKKFLKNKNKCAVKTVKCVFEWDQLTGLANKETFATRLLITVEYIFFKLLIIWKLDDQGQLFDNADFALQHAFLNNSRFDQIGKSLIMCELNETIKDKGFCDLITTEAQAYVDQCMSTMDHEKIKLDESNNIMFNPVACNTIHFEKRSKKANWQKIE